MAQGGGENRSSIEVQYGDAAQAGDDVLTYRRSVDPEFGVGVDARIGLEVNRVFEVGIKGAKAGVFYFPHRQAWVFSDPYKADNTVGRNTQALLLVDAFERAFPNNPVSQLLHLLAEQVYSQANAAAYLQRKGDGYGVRGEDHGLGRRDVEEPGHQC